MIPKKNVSILNNIQEKNILILLGNVSVKISFESPQIALVAQSWSTVLFHHVFCSGLCGNVDNNLPKTWK
jgi:hypothetical protein